MDPVTADDPPLLYRVSEAANLLAISKSKLYVLMTRGDIESVKIGGARRIPHDAVTTYIKKLRTGAGL